MPINNLQTDEGSRFEEIRIWAPNWAFFGLGKLLPIAKPKSLYWVVGIEDEPISPGRLMPVILGLFSKSESSVKANKYRDNEQAM